MSDHPTIESAGRRGLVESIFNAAADVPRDRREAVLAERCGGDSTLRGEIEELLRQFDAGTMSMLQKPAGAILRENSEKVGDVIGHYRLEEVLGEGGFGLVYLAEQTEPVRRRVALKLLKPGMDTRAVLGRFEGERHALALMDHPSIAKVLDAGSTPLGRPYFVMEFVRGQPLNTYCDERRLGVRQRLELFIQVCMAVQHAHQKGVIHRDLKPSNVLVTETDGKPLPKVIDFGIAKALHESAGGDQTVFTQQGQIIGTPEYMSPEQAAPAPGIGGLDIDTRTDVYSLGVILYELVTGALPFDSGSLRSRGLAAMQQIIREVDPPRPSTRLGSLSADLSGEAAARRATDPGSLVRQVRGDLEWIILKAIEKDRARRYDAVSSLARDVERHLRDEPVSASPPSTSYRLGKFIKRNRVGVFAGSAVAAAIAVGSVASAIGFIRASDERDRAIAAQNLAIEKSRQTEVARDQAQVAADKAKAINDFLLIKMLEAASPWKDGRDVTVAAVLARAEQQVEDAFAGQPEVRAAVEHTLGETNQKLGKFEDARRLLTASLATRRTLLGDSHPDTLETRRVLAVVGHAQGSYDVAITELEALLAEAEKHFGEKHPFTAQVMSDTAASAARLGDFDRSEKLLRRVVELRTEIFGPDAAETLLCRSSLASLLIEAGKVDEAERICERLLIGWREVGKDQSPQMVHTLADIATIAEIRGDFENGEPIARQALDMARVVYGSDHPSTILATNSVANLLRMQGSHLEAEVFYKESLETLHKTVGPDHSWTLTVQNNYANSLMRLKRWAEAEELITRSLEVRRRTLGERHPEIANSLEALGILHARQGRYSEAVQIQRQALEIALETIGPDHSDTQNMMSNLAGYLIRTDQPGEAAEVLAKLVEAEVKTLGPNHKYVHGDRDTLIEALLKAGKPEEALPLARLNLAIGREHLADNLRASIRGPLALAETLLALKQFEEAEHLLIEANTLTLTIADNPEMRSGFEARLAPAFATVYEALGKAELAAEWRGKASQAPAP